MNLATFARIGLGILLMPQAALAAPASSGAFGLPMLSPVFGDHMVLQRDRPNRFWGWAKPGTSMRVTIAGNSAEAVADKTGKWSAQLTPPAAGGPYRVVIEGAGRVELDDVMVGDVWLCTGQSNMELGVSTALNGTTETAAADHPEIRLYMAPRKFAYSPQSTNPGEWQVCTPKTVGKGGWGGFSAVGYYFGRELHEKLKVPIGLVQAAWGGTSAEAWTSRDGLKGISDFDADVAAIDAAREYGAPNFGTYIDAWFGVYDAGSRPGAEWQQVDYDASNWRTTTLPGGFDGMGLTPQGGSVWFRRDVTLPDSYKQGDSGVLSLGKIGRISSTYVNGTMLGFSNSADEFRRYDCWNWMLKPGRNVIAVRVLDTGTTEAPAGFNSSPDDLFLKPEGGTTISLAGQWRAKVGLDFRSVPAPPSDMSTNPTVPTVLANGMIAPLAHLAIRGVIWYQGETNVGRATQYQKLLPALIADWRRMFAQGDFPFYIVSLCTDVKRPEEPGDDAWAELREAQALTAAKVPNSGLAVTIDVGDPGNVHAKDKQTVGHRLAAVALAKEYHQNVVDSGPVYRSMTRQGSSARLTFDHTEQGLHIKGEDLLGFTIAGPDHKWHRADAQLDGNAVLVSTPGVAEPAAVRYAWGASPDANLYNGAGFPAVPFRTDDWSAPK